MHLRSSQYSQRPVRRSGIIFVTALWITVILTALVLVFAREMRTEVIASGNRLAEQQASSLELGAEQYVLAAIDGCAGDAVSVLSTQAEQVQIGSGYFWILQADPTSDYNYAFGITDESSKLNLNVAAANDLAALPGMDSDTASNIVAWRTSNSSSSSSGGVGNSYYEQLPRPYSAKNAAFETVEELYLVKGIDDKMLWGYDLDHNQMIDSAEQGANGLSTLFNSASDTGRGIYPFITVWGSEANTTSKGAPRININNPGQRPALQALLARKLGATRTMQIMGLVLTTPVFRSVFDFADKARLKSSELSQIYDNLTTSPATKLTGLVNLNTAPKQVLMCLPGLNQTDADTIVASRPSATSSSAVSSALGSVTGGASNAITSSGNTSISWLLDTITPAKAAVIGNRVTGQSFFYSADIVAVPAGGRSFKRVRIVVDATKSPAVIVYRKDLTSLGWPLDPAIREALRAGSSLPAATGQGTGASNGLSNGFVF